LTHKRVQITNTDGNTTLRRRSNCIKISS